MLHVLPESYSAVFTVTSHTKMVQILYSKKMFLCPRSVCVCYYTNMFDIIFMIFRKKKKIIDVALAKTWVKCVCVGGGVFYYKHGFLIFGLNTL